MDGIKSNVGFGATLGDFAKIIFGNNFALQPELLYHSNMNQTGMMKLKVAVGIILHCRGQTSSIVIFIPRPKSGMAGWVGEDNHNLFDYREMFFRTLPSRAYLRYSD